MPYTLCGILLLQFLCCSMLLFWSAMTSKIEHGPWDYDTRGPDTWATLYKQFCAGRKQSPVDLSPRDSEYDTTLTEYSLRVTETPEYTLKLANDGHKLLITMGSNLEIRKGLGDKMFYTAQQLHWHWGGVNSRGSEHTVVGKAYPMEGHLVFWNSLDYANFSTAVHSVGGLAVLGVFYHLSTEDNPLLLAIEKYLPQLVNANTAVDVTFKANELNFLDAFLPKSQRDFYRYEGSLTTPSCNENVLWTVFTTTVPVSERQLALLRGLRYPNGKPCVDNYRPVQPLNPVGRPGARRLVYRTFGWARGRRPDGSSGQPAASVPALLTLAAAVAISLGCPLFGRRG